MNKLKLALLFIIINIPIIHADEESNFQEDIPAVEISQSQQYIDIETIIADAHRSLPQIDLVQSITANKLQTTLQRLRVQQIALLTALAHNNDELLRALHNPLQQPVHTQYLLTTSREILALSSDIDLYINAKSI